MRRSVAELLGARGRGRGSARWARASVSRPMGDGVAVSIIALRRGARGPLVLLLLMLLMLLILLMLGGMVTVALLLLVLLVLLVVLLLLLRWVLPIALLRRRLTVALLGRWLTILSLPIAAAPILLGRGLMVARPRTGARSVTLTRVSVRHAAATVLRL